MRERGYALPVVFAFIVIMMSMTMMSLSNSNFNSYLTRSIYCQAVTTNTAESGIAAGTVPLLADAANGFVNVLGSENPDVAVTNEERLLINGSLEYVSFGNADYRVFIRDNDDLDGDFTVDVDKRFLIHTEGSMAAGCETNLEVMAVYLGNDDEYAQSTGTSKSNSHFSSELEIQSF